ncbi:MAG: hypothetical protein ACOYWZ_09210 [Bacillota bacterium]
MPLDDKLQISFCAAAVIITICLTSYLLVNSKKSRLLASYISVLAMVFIYALGRTLEI